MNKNLIWIIVINRMIKKYGDLEKNKYTNRLFSI